MPNEDLSFDVIVVGSGAAGLTAAITAKLKGADKVIVLEKADLIGGTTAWSGGQVWIPNNPHMSDVGIEDSREKSLVAATRRDGRSKSPGGAVDAATGQVVE